MFYGYFLYARVLSSRWALLSCRQLEVNQCCALYCDNQHFKILCHSKKCTCTYSAVPLISLAWHCAPVPYQKMQQMTCGRRVIFCTSCLDHGQLLMMFGCIYTFFKSRLLLCLLPPTPFPFFFNLTQLTVSPL